jgi:hypothetical protein
MGERILRGKSALAQFNKDFPSHFVGENEWLENLHQLENQERLERGLASKRHDLEFGLGNDDYLDTLNFQHEKQEREIQRRENPSPKQG